MKSGSSAVPLRPLCAYTWSSNLSRMHFGRALEVTVALSESERRLLDQIEKGLAAEDPKLVHSFRGVPRQRRLHPRRATAAGLGFLAGVALLIGGMLTWPGISVLGFVVMVACAVIALQAWQPAPPEEAAEPADDDPPRSGDGAHRGPSGVGDDSQFGAGFMDRMEERWRRRRDEDF